MKGGGGRKEPHRPLPWSLLPSTPTDLIIHFLAPATYFHRILDLKLQYLPHYIILLVYPYPCYLVNPIETGNIIHITETGT